MTGAMLLTGLAANAEPVGLARSQAGFSVKKAEAVRDVARDAAATVETGDEIVASGDTVQVGLLNRGTVMVDRQSSARVVAPNKLELTKGNMMTAQPADESVAVAYKDLVFVPTPAAAATTSTDAQGLLLLSQGEEGVLRATGSNKTFTVHRAGEEDKALAVLGNGDALEFREVAGEWQVNGIQHLSPFAQLFDGPGVVQQGAFTPDRRRIAGFWWGTGGLIVLGGAGAAGATYAIIEATNDDDGGGGGSGSGGGGGGGFFSPVF